MDGISDDLSTEYEQDEQKVLIQIWAIKQAFSAQFLGLTNMKRINTSDVKVRVE